MVSDGRDVAGGKALIVLAIVLTEIFCPSCGTDDKQPSARDASSAKDLTPATTPPPKGPDLPAAVIEAQSKVRRAVGEDPEDYGRLYDIGIELDYLDKSRLLEATRASQRRSPARPYEVTWARGPRGGAPIAKPGFEQLVEFGLGRLPFYGIIVHGKPPFYVGQTPFPILAGIELSSSGPPMRVGFYCLPEWDVFFSIRRTAGVPLWAVALHRGNICAESTVVSMENASFEVLEVHLGPPYRPLTTGRTGTESGAVVFCSRSRYDLKTGFKVSESGVYGKKEKDYFYLWYVPTPH